VTHNVFFWFAIIMWLLL